MNMLGLLIVGMLGLGLIGCYLDGDRVIYWPFVLLVVVVPFNDTLILLKKKSLLSASFLMMWQYALIEIFENQYCVRC